MPVGPLPMWNATADENSFQHIELPYLKSLCLLSSLPENFVQLLWPHTNITRKWAYVSIISTNGGRMWINAPAPSLSIGVCPRYIPQCVRGSLQDGSPFAHIYQYNPSLETLDWLFYLQSLMIIISSLVLLGATSWINHLPLSPCLRICTSNSNWFTLSTQSTQFTTHE